VKAKTNNDFELAQKYYKLADSKFKEALQYNKNKGQMSLYTDYINFLIETSSYKELYEYLKLSITDNSNHLLNYKLLRTDQVSEIVKEKVVTTKEKLIVIGAKEYAYYLLLHHYKDFEQLKIEGLAKIEEYLEQFIKLIVNSKATNASSISHYLLGHIYKEYGDEEKAKEEFKILDLIQKQLYENQINLNNQQYEQNMINEKIVLDIKNDNDEDSNIEVLGENQDNMN
jgi:hypothetical protein